MLYTEDTRQIGKTNTYLNLFEKNSIFGKDEPKAPTMHIKPKDPKSFVTPAPGAYNPELAEKDVKLAAPKYSFGIKSKDSKSIPGPGKRIKLL